MNNECPSCFNTVAPHDTECKTCGVELAPIDNASISVSKNATTWTSTNQNASKPTGLSGGFHSKTSGWGSGRTTPKQVEEPPKAKTPRGVAIVQEGATTDSITLLEGKTSIGRDEEHDITLNDDRVSSFHSIIYLDEKSQRYLDISTNGSKINGVTCHYDKIELLNGARIEIGDVIITFVLIPSAG